MATSSITMPVRVTREKDIMTIYDAYKKAEKELNSFPDFGWMDSKEREKTQEDMRHLFSTLVVK